MSRQPIRIAPIQPKPADPALRPGIPTGPYSRHILICADQSEPKCAPRETTLAVWNHLKKRLAERGLASGDGCVYRSKVNCLRVCTHGPVAVVYPEGVWYHSVTPELIDRILDEHIAGGRPIEEFVFVTNPLSCETGGEGELQ